MKIPGVERVIRLLLPHGFQEFLLLQRVDAVIAEHVMPLLADGREIPVNPLQVAEFGFYRVGRVDEVAEFDEKRRLVFGEFGGGFCQLVRGLAIVSGA